MGVWLGWPAGGLASDKVPIRRVGLFNRGRFQAPTLEAGYSSRGIQACIAVLGLRHALFEALV